jgi:hypothetical protein
VLGSSAKTLSPRWAQGKLRLRTERSAARLLDRLVADHLATSWVGGVYEPETDAFGGPEARDVAHQVFCADSRSALAESGSPCARERCVLLISAMNRAAGLDPVEVGDVWAKVASLRPAIEPPTGIRRAAAVTAMRRLMNADPPNGTSPSRAGLSVSPRSRKPEQPLALPVTHIATSSCSTRADAGLEVAARNKVLAAGDAAEHSQVPGTVGCRDRDQVASSAAHRAADRPRQPAQAPGQRTQAQDQFVARSVDQRGEGRDGRRAVPGLIGADHTLSDARTGS